MTATNKLLTAFAIGLMLVLPMVAICSDGDTFQTDAATADNDIPDSDRLPFIFKAYQDPVDPRTPEKTTLCLHIEGLKNVHQEFESKMLEIPSLVKFDGKIIPVTAIGYGAFDFHLTDVRESPFLGMNVVIPSSIKSLDAGAFYKTGIASIHFEGERLENWGSYCLYTENPLTVSGPKWVDELFTDEEFLGYATAYADGYEVSVLPPHEQAPLFTTEMILCAIVAIAFILFILWIATHLKKQKE